MEIEEIQSLDGLDCGYYYIASHRIAFRFSEPQFKYEHSANRAALFICFAFILSVENMFSDFALAAPAATT